MRRLLALLLLVSLAGCSKPAETPPPPATTTQPATATAPATQPETLPASFLPALQERVMQANGPVDALAIGEVRATRPGLLITASDLATLTRFRAETEPFLMQLLREKNPGAAYYLAYLKSTPALPTLRDLFVNDRYFYAWEGLDYRKTASYLRDEQYPHHLAYMTAIETITDKPLAATVQLTPAERKLLTTQAAKAKPAKAKTEHAFNAKWILSKLPITPSTPAIVATANVLGTPTTRPTTPHFAATRPSNPLPAGMYQVQKGDSLTLIARRNNLTVAALLQANPRLARRPNLIFVGQSIKLPAPPSATAP